jgi:hypothetical protein
MVKKSGVLYAARASTLKNAHLPSGILGKLQNSYHPKRSGDILLELEAGTEEYPESTGSSFNYDNHIPLIWYGMDITPGEVNKKLYLKDVTPTICKLLHIPLPDASDGEPVKELLDNHGKK